jgi:uncharacterized LabA/DUF88 family protein
LRAFVYVDGFNLYYRGLKRTPYKWLNVTRLAQELLSSDDTVGKVRYFTADVSPRSGDADAPQRQQAYLRALRTLPEVTIHKGRFLPKTKTRPLVSDPTRFVEVHDTEEKGSDVNLASHLLNDAFNDRFDVALIISQDSDLCEPMRMVCKEIGKIVGIGWVETSAPGKRYRAVSSFIRHASTTMLSNSQFPDPVIGRGGAHIAKPPTW